MATRLLPTLLQQLEEAAAAGRVRCTRAGLTTTILPPILSKCDCLRTCHHSINNNINISINHPILLRMRHIKHNNIPIHTPLTITHTLLILPSNLPRPCPTAITTTSRFPCSRTATRHTYLAASVPVAVPADRAKETMP